MDSGLGGLGIGVPPPRSRLGGGVLWMVARVEVGGLESQAVTGADSSWSCRPRILLLLMKRTMVLLINLQNRRRCVAVHPPNFASVMVHRDRSFKIEHRN
jgi:hypothetical protein